MWAMTNISEYELQMQICNVVLTTNTMQNCFERGIYMQLCGSHDVGYLWLISDSDQNRETGYLSEQAEFQSTGVVKGVRS